MSQVKWSSLKKGQIVPHFFFFQAVIWIESHFSMSNALEFNICLSLAWIFQFTPLSIFIKSSRLLNKNGSILQVYFSNFLFQLSNSEIGWENEIFLLFEKLEPNFSVLCTLLLGLSFHLVGKSSSTRVDPWFIIINVSFFWVIQNQSGNICASISVSKH